MAVHNHRASCEQTGCSWVRRENCADCLRDVADAHRAETGHPVHLTITSDEQLRDNILTMATRARRMLLTGRVD